MNKMPTFLEQSGSNGTRVTLREASQAWRCHVQSCLYLKCWGFVHHGCFALILIFFFNFALLRPGESLTCLTLIPPWVGGWGLHFQQRDLAEKLPQASISHASVDTPQRRPQKLFICIQSTFLFSHAPNMALSVCHESATRGNFHVERGPGVLAPSPMFTGRN